MTQLQLSLNWVATFVAERKALEEVIRIKINEELAQEQRRKEELYNGL